MLSFALFNRWLLSYWEAECFCESVQGGLGCAYASFLPVCAFTATSGLSAQSVGYWKHNTPTAFPDKLYPAIAVGFQAPCSQRFCLWAWRNTGLGPAETHKLTPILFNQVTPWYFAGSESSQPVKGSLDEVWSRHIKLGQWPVRFLLRAGLLRVGSNIHLSGKSFVSLKEGRGAYICTLLPPV